MSEQASFDDISEHSTHSEWKTRTFTEIISINDYPPLEKGHEHTYISMSDLNVYERKIQNKQQKEYKYSAPRFRNEDTLFPKMSRCLENGKTAYVDVLDEGEIAFGSTEFLVLRPKEDILPKFIYYTVRRPDVWRKAFKWRNGTTARRQRISTDVFDEIEIDVPPIEEQEKIVEFLDALDSRFENNQREIKILEGIVRSIFRSWFVDFEPYDEFKDSERGEIPSEFEVVDFTDIAKVTYGYGFKSELFNESEEGVPVVRIRDIEESDISTYTPEEFDSKYWIEPGDVLAGMDGEFFVNIWKNKEAALNQRVCRFEGTKDCYSNMLLYFLIETPLKRLTQTKTGTTVKHLGKSDIDEIKVICPGEKSLEKFNKIVEPIYRLMVSHGLENNPLAETRDLLLPKLMTGEVRVSDINLGKEQKINGE